MKSNRALDVVKMRITSRAELLLIRSAYISHTTTKMAKVR